MKSQNSAKGVNVGIDADIHMRLKIMAIKKGITLFQLVNDYVKEGLDSMGPISKGGQSTPAPVTSFPSEIHFCEAPMCKRADTKLVKREGVDDEGSLKTYEKWLCPVHAIIKGWVIPTRT